MDWLQFLRGVWIKTKVVIRQNLIRWNIVEFLALEILSLGVYRVHDLNLVGRIPRFIDRLHPILDLLDSLSLVNHDFIFSQGSRLIKLI